MAQRISVTARDGHAFSAWTAAPDDDAKGGIVLLQAIYGLTSHLGDVCDGFAGDGYAAIAPALYDRTEPDRVFSYDQAGVAAGTAFRENLNEATVSLDVSACAYYLRRSVRNVAISGFCTGGSWAWICADALDFDAAVIFYGSDVFRLLDRKPRCPTILHYGDSDHVVPIDQVTEIGAMNPQCGLYVYPGCGHAFFNPEQAHYDAAAAALAQRRTVEFLDCRFAAS